MRVYWRCSNFSDVEEKLYKMFFYLCGINERIKMSIVVPLF
jgi:hypothetical protein